MRYTNAPHQRLAPVLLASILVAAMGAAASADAPNAEAAPLADPPAASPPSAAPATAPAAATLPTIAPTHVMPLGDAQVVSNVVVSADGSRIYLVEVVPAVYVWEVVCYFWPNGSGVLLGLLVLVAAWRIWRAPRGQIKGQPYCRRCGYAWSNLTSNACPECGLEVTSRNQRRGRSYAARTAPWMLGVLIAGVCWMSAILLIGHGVPKGVRQWSNWTSTWLAVAAVDPSGRLRVWLTRLVEIDANSGRRARTVFSETFDSFPIGTVHHSQSPAYRISKSPRRLALVRNVASTFVTSMSLSYARSSLMVWGPNGRLIFLGGNSDAGADRMAEVSFPADAIAFTPSGDALYLADHIRTPHRVDFKRQRVRYASDVEIVRHAAPATNPDDPPFVQFWDVEATPPKLHVFNDQFAPRWSMALSPDRRRLLHCFRSANIQRWDLVDSKPDGATLATPDGLFLNALAVAPQGKRLAASTIDVLRIGHAAPTAGVPMPGRLAVFIADLEPDRWIARLDLGREESVRDLAISPDGRTAVVIAGASVQQPPLPPDRLYIFRLPPKGK